MNILAIDQSTEHCTAAITTANPSPFRVDWDSGFMRNQDVFQHLSKLFRMSSLEPETLDLMAVGTGPGSFAGIRTAISAVNGLAIPYNKNIIGISAGTAIAYDILRSGTDKPVIIVGDARRERLWHTRFTSNDDILTKVPEYGLIEKGNFPELLDQDIIIATPDWHRLETYLLEIIPVGVNIILEQRVPDAVTIAGLAEKIYSLSPNITKQPVLPIYMHPPVATAAKQ